MLFSLTLLLIFFECFLRAYYWGDYYWKKSKSVTTPRAQKILCIGNSFTQGSGAPAGESYPDHLQRFLDQDSFFYSQVINLGRGAFNTTLILENLNSWLAEYRPKFVLLQVGEPNYWNLYGYDQFIGSKDHSFKNFVSNHSAVVRFFTFLKTMNETKEIKTSDYIWSQSDSIYQSKYSDDFNELKDFTLNCLIAENKIDFKSRLLNSSAYKALNDQYRKGEAIYNSFPHSPSALRLMYDLEASCKLNIPKAIPFLNSLIQLEPPKTLSLLNDAWRTLNSNAYPSETRQKDTEAYINYLKDKHPEYLKVVTANTPPRYKDWIISDLRKMITLIKNQGAIPVILNYPPTVKEIPREIDELLRNFAKNENLTFIDIEKHFLEIWSQQRFKKNDLHEIRLGVPLDHLNGQGYKLVAEEIFKEMHSFKSL